MDRSSYDRFSSHEDIEFDTVAFDYGMYARNQGGGMSGSNPYHPVAERFLNRSFNAGWADADMSIMAEAG